MPCLKYNDAETCAGYDANKLCMQCDKNARISQEERIKTPAKAAPRGTKEIAKQIRQDLKTMTGYVFSVTMETFAGGSSINVDVMSAPIQMIRNMDEIPEHTNVQNYTRAQIIEMQAKKYHQLSQYQLRQSDEYDPRTWNNGVFLTEAGHNDLKRIVDIVETYHRNSSDSSLDYFCCNFYFHLNLGKWDKSFVDGAQIQPLQTPMLQVRTC